MNYYSDPTASRALGNLNREFACYKKQAKKIRALLRAGELTPKQAERACLQFPGVYRQLLIRLVNEPEETTAPAEKSAGAVA